MLITYHLISVSFARDGTANCLSEIVNRIYLSGMLICAKVAVNGEN